MDVANEHSKTYLSPNYCTAHNLLMYAIMWVVYASNSYRFQSCYKKVQYWHWIKIMPHTQTEKCWSHKILLERKLFKPVSGWRSFTIFTRASIH